MLGIIAEVVTSILSLYLFVLLVRAVFDWIVVLSRGWRPRGIILILANICYALTDPPLKFLNRFIPPLRMGAVSMDMGFLVLFFGISILIRVVQLVSF